MKRKRGPLSTRNAKHSEIFQEPIKTGGKRTRGKGNKPMTKKTQTQVEDLSDTDDEIPGYLCVSADPRRSGSAEGGENFIITAEELRLLLQVQCQVEDQTVLLTTSQTRRYQATFFSDSRNCYRNNEPPQCQKLELWN